MQKVYACMQEGKALGEGQRPEQLKSQDNCPVKNSKNQCQTTTGRADKAPKDDDNATTPHSLQI